MGKPSRNGSKGWRVRGWIGYVLSFVFGFLLAFMAYAYLIKEKPLSPERFSQKVLLADQIIQSQLFEIGLTQKDILLDQVSSKKDLVIMKFPLLLPPFPLPLWKRILNGAYLFLANLCRFVLRVVIISAIGDKDS